MTKKLLSTYNQLPLPVKAGIWFTICNFIQKGISFITIPVFTRIMTTEEYGLYSIYLSWYNFLTIIGTLHLSYYVFDKGLVKYENDKEEFVISIQSLSAVLTLGLVIIYFSLKTWLDPLIQIPTAMMICMLVQIFFEPPVLYWTARKRFEYRYYAVLIVTLAIAVLNPALGILLIKLHYFDNATLARVISVSLISVVSGIGLGAVIISRAKLLFSIKYWAYALNFNLPLVPHFLSTTVLVSSDKIMIGDMIGKSEAGIYSVAYSVGVVLTLLSQSTHHAILPWLYKKIKVNDYTDIAKIFSFLLFGIMMIIALLIAFAPDIVYIVGSSKYADAIWVVPPICGSVFYIFLRDLFANIEYYFEKTKLISAASVGVAALNISLNYIFIKKYGYYAAGYTTLFCYFLLAIVHFCVMRHICVTNGINVRVFVNTKVISILSIIVFIIIGGMLFIYHFAFLRYLIIFSILLFLLINYKRFYRIVSLTHNNK